LNLSDSANDPASAVADSDSIARARDKFAQYRKALGLSFRRKIDLSRAAHSE
jgi:hypothetical protein